MGESDLKHALGEQFWYLPSAAEIDGSVVDYSIWHIMNSHTFYVSQGERDLRAGWSRGDAIVKQEHWWRIPPRRLNYLPKAQEMAGCAPPFVSSATSLGSWLV